MANTPPESSPFNPMLFWTDLTLRAADLAMASAQNLGDGIDRFARAEALQPVLFFHPPQGPSAADGPEAADAPATHADAGPPLDPFALWQALGIEMASRGWQQWLASMGSLGNLWSAGAGRSLLAPGWMAPNPWAALARAPGQAAGGRPGPRGKAERESPAAGWLEHAAAGQEKRTGGRRRRGSAKPSAGR